MTIKEPYASRLKSLRRAMADRGMQAHLVSRPENRFYLSGFTASDPQLDESSGTLLITKSKQYLLTDFRYEIQAQKEAPGFEVVLYNPGLAQTVGPLISRHRVGKLGIEDDHLTVRAFQLLNDELTNASLEPAADMVSALRVRKDPGELRLIRRALKITEAALAQTISALKPGLTEEEIARGLEETMVQLGASGPAFESIVASGPNAALPHAVPTRRKIREGETIIIDCGAKYKNYRADMTRTIVLGTPPAWVRPIYNLVRRAQLTALKVLGPGLKTDEADLAARTPIEEAGWGPNFGHSLGHGVGLATHEQPTLSRLRSTVLEPGMVVTIEPGVYLPGRGGVRLEEMAAITEKGCSLLNKDRNFYDWID